MRRADPGAGDERVLPSPSLHACMVGMVLMNLVFVQLTEAASMAWLLPLYGLTLASWGFARFKERFLYRALWNLGVLGFFVKLLNHALSADLAYVLQDGLTLAVLCQVHLLNNLHRNQRPDLLFLNSYLIAVITGYITVDLGFSGAFLGYVPFYILGLQFLAVFRPGGRLSGREVRLLAFDGFKRSALLLTLALLAFAFWPRDFEREALLARYFEFDTSSGPSKVDFSESLDLAKRRGGEGDEGEVVLTIRPVAMSQADSGWEKVEEIAMPELWRGAALGRHRRDGSWGRLRDLASETPTADPAWETAPNRGAALRESVPGAPRRRLRAVRAGGSTQVAFLPYNAVEVELDGVHRAGVLQVEPEGTMRYSNPGELRYELVLGELGVAGDPDAEIYTRLESSPHTKTAVDLAKLLREKRIGQGAESREVAQGFSNYLRERYPYRLPDGDEEDASATLHEFLTTEKGGHCEFFASALATMLRAESIPARVVTGFRVGAMDAETGAWTVRSTSAHAWVEAFTDGGWQTLDPTPAADEIVETESWFDRANAAAMALWNRVTSFDAESRAQLTSWVGNLPARAFGWMAGSPWTASVGLGGLFVLMGWTVRRRRARTPQTVRALDQALRAARVQRGVGETPREALARAESLEGLDVDRLEALRGAVVDHEKARFSSAVG